MNKKTLSERDICTKYISPAVLNAGWDIQKQVREEFSFTAGRIYVKGNLWTRGKQKRADYLLYHKPNIPIAIIEAKDNNHTISAGMQQALDYAAILDVPVAFSSNGDGFIMHDRTASSGNIETQLSNEQFPSPGELWQIYKKYKGITDPAVEKIAKQEYDYKPQKQLRYFQQIAVNRAVEAIAKEQNRILLTMATGAGKTLAAYHIIYRLWKAGVKKRILFLADRNALIDQAKRNDFQYFGDKITIVRKKTIDKSYEIYLALYQGLMNYNEDKDAYKEFSRDFFDLVIIDECHRGSAAEDSAWREILDYFDKATHIGLTATPKETKDVSNIEYFGDPIYTYSLRQGISDGFLAPYKVLRCGLNVDLEGWRPEEGKTDVNGNKVEDREYNTNDYDRNLVIDERTKFVAKRISEYLRKHNRFDKTIVFCIDIEHAERMRRALINENSDLASANPKYVMKITGDDEAGKRELDNFINPEETYPVIATTSKLMTTGIDAQTCKLIVLDSNINSMTEFKQIIGRGTRINEEYNKYFFTIMDFRNVTRHFADPNFDGEPVMIKVVEPDDEMPTIEEEEIITETFTDELTGEEIDFQLKEPEYPYAADIENEEGHKRREKIYVNGVNVSLLNERVQYVDGNGKLITGSLKDYTKTMVQKNYRSLDDFINKWNAAEQKQILIDEMLEQGIIIGSFLDDINKEMDVFDLILHAAFDQPPLSRKERAENVKRRNYFSKYSDKTKKVLENLLDKYADGGIENIEDLTVLKIFPFNEIGSPSEIISLFGDKEKYLTAIKELESQIYGAA
jgi:type I restriction enzyme R subunit